jgi:hypothetical protein
VFEVLQGLVGGEDPNAPEGKSQVFEVFNPDHSTLLAIDLEFERLGQVTANACHHPPPCPSTFDQDYQVVPVAGKAMPSRCKLFIGVIQENIGQ